MCVRMLSAASRIWQRAWRALTRSVHERYRPEQHYMRGPGPKYRAKGNERNGGKSGLSLTGANDNAKSERGPGSPPCPEEQFRRWPAWFRVLTPRTDGKKLWGFEVAICTGAVGGIGVKVTAASCASLHPSPGRWHRTGLRDIASSQNA